MSRIAYRIGTDTPAYAADDLSGKGEEITGGRWTEKGAAVVYAAESRSLARLEEKFCCPQTQRGLEAAATASD